MSNSLNLVPDREISMMEEPLARWQSNLARLITHQNLDQFLHRYCQSVFDLGLEALGAHEGTIWTIDSEESYLLPIYNNGPDHERFVGGFQQPLGEGMLSMVFASGQLLCEDQVYQSNKQHKKLDQELEKLTCTMIAAPLFFGGRLRGVISAVKLKSRESPEDLDPKGFSGEDAESLGDLSQVIGRLIDHRLIELGFCGSDE